MACQKGWSFYCNSWSDKKPEFFPASSTFLMDFIRLLARLDKHKLTALPIGSMQLKEVLENERYYLYYECL